MKFGAGINNDEPHSDGFNTERTIALTTEPTEYFVDLRSITYLSVVGVFVWVAETPTGTGDMTFFIDNIEWTADEPADNGLAVPFWIDDHYIMSGFFPGPPGTVDVVENCDGAAGTDPSSVCRRITVTPNGLTFAGFFFQYPANNWGAQPGLLVAPGASQITFRAWGATGSESVKFGAGIDNAEMYSDGWNIEIIPAPLPTVPTEYSVDISNVSYELVAGGFLWVVELDGSTPVTFYLDNVRWQ